MPQRALEELERSAAAAALDGQPSRGSVPEAPVAIAQPTRAAIAADSVRAVRALMPQLAAFGTLTVVGVLPNRPDSVQLAAEMHARILFVVGEEDMSAWLNALDGRRTGHQPALIFLNTNGRRAARARNEPLRAQAATAAAPHGAGPNQLRDTLVLDERERLLILRYHEIDWVRADGRWTTVYCGETIHIVRRSLASLERLLDVAHFVRIHRTLIVRLDRVREISPSFHGDYDVLLHNGMRLPLSRSYVKQFMARTAMPTQTEAVGGARRRAQEPSAGANEAAGTGALNR